MIIKTYSAIRNDAFASIDYQACKLFFPCDETSGNSLTDVVSGSAYAMGVTLNYGTANAVTMTSGSSISPIALGTSIAIGTKSALLFGVVKMSGVSSIGIGTSGPSYPHMALGATATCYANDASNTNETAPGSLTANTLVGGAIAVVPGVAQEGTRYQATTSTWTTPASAAAAPAAITTMPTITHIRDWVANSANMNIYGLALFVFDNGIPADVKAAIAWMTAEWQNGNKAIYPGWKGLS